MTNYVCPEQKQKFAHVEIIVTYNTSDYSTWNDPQGKEKVKFDYPIYMFESMNYSELVKDMVEEAHRLYLVAVEEAEKKAMEEALEENEDD